MPGWDHHDAWCRVHNSLPGTGTVPEGIMGVIYA